MRYIYCLLLLLASSSCSSQGFKFPKTRYLDDATTKTVVNGGLEVIKGLINARYNDTSDANNQYIKFYHGAQIVVGNDIWVRDLTMSKWIKISGGSSSSSDDSTNMVMVKNISDLKSGSYHVINSKKKNSNDKTAVHLSGYYNAGDGGGGAFYWDDTATISEDNGMVIKPTSVSGAGRWKRVTDANYVNVLWFGFKADGATDNIQMWDNMMVYLNRNAVYSIKGNTSYLYFKRFPKILIPAANGYYYFSTTLTWYQNMEVEGESSFHTNWASALSFPAGTMGVKIYGSQVFAADSGAQGTIVRNILLHANGASTDTTVHGWDIKCRVYMENCGAEQFGGNGFHLDGSDGTYTDHSYFDKCFSAFNFNGWYIKGPDANVIQFNNCDARANYRAGFYDLGFLGNTYINCHTASNAEIPDVRNKSTVWHNGKMYWARLDGVLSEPGVAAGWRNEWVEGPSSLCYGGIPGWVTSTWYARGGGYLIDFNAEGGQNANGLLLGCYSEGCQPPSFIGSRSMSISGQHGAGFAARDSGDKQVVLDAQEKSFVMSKTSLIAGSLGDLHAYISPSLGAVPSPVLGLRGAGTGIDMMLDTATKSMVFKDPTNNNQFTRIVTSITNPSSYGRNDIRGGLLTHLYGLYLGNENDHSLVNFFSVGTSAPGSGTWTTGDFILNANSGNTLGWRCTASGTPGTWETVTSGGWSLSGNTLTSGASTGSFIGSTNNVSMRFRTNNLERMVIDSNTGNVGIGTAPTAAKLRVNGIASITGELIFGGSLSPNGISGSPGQLLTSEGSGTYPTWKEPNEIITMQIVDQRVNTVGNTGTSETNLHQLETDPTKMQVDEESLTGEFTGLYNSTTASITIKIYFESNSTDNLIFDSGALISSLAGGAWSANFSIYRTSNSAAKAKVVFNSPTTGTPSFVVYTDLTGLDFSETGSIKISGTSDDTDDDVQAMISKVYWSAAKAH